MSKFEKDMLEICGKESGDGINMDGVDAESMDKMVGKQIPLSEYYAKKKKDDLTFGRPELMGDHQKEQYEDQ